MDKTKFHNTLVFNLEKDKELRVDEILKKVYDALLERGYSPLDQLVGYIMSDDPTYITNHKNARTLITKIERNELITELLKSYLNIK